MGKKHKTILIVDDDRDIVSAISTILSMESYDILAAYTGEESLTMLEKSKPDLLLLDYMLTDMKGKDIVEKVRNTPTLSNLPIILISAAHGVENIGQSLAIDDWIEKPFELEVLLEKISANL